MTSARTLLLLVLALCLLPLGPVLPGLAEEDEEALEVRFHEVGALTAGHPWFIRPVMGVQSPDMVSDEDSPLFGAEGEEPLLPLGTVDELIEIVKMHVEPVLWEITEGADIYSLGESTLVVRAPASLHEAVAGYLASMETAVLTPVAVEIRALRVRADAPPAALAAAGRGALGDEALAALLAASEPGPSISLTALSGQTATAFHGRQRSFVQDYDTEVATKARISDPIVGVANLGIAAQVRATLGNEPGTLTLGLHAVLARYEGSRYHTTEDERTIELPTLDLCRVTEDLVVTPGAWHAADGRLAGEGNACWLVLVRATPVPHVGRRRTPPVVFPSTRADAGALEGRSFEVGDLDVAPENYVGREINLVPSNFTPPEPPELAEPMPIFPLEGVVDLVRVLVAPRSWNRDGASIEVRGQRLFVRNTERVLSTIEASLNTLRRLFMTSVVCEVEVYDVPVDLAWRIRAPGPGGEGSMFWSPDRLPEEGDVRLLERVQVHSMAGARNNVSLGTEFSYLQDFEVEIAENADVPNPVVQTGYAGVVVDVHPADTSTGDAVNVCVRFTRSRLVEPLREAETPHGPLDVPELDLVRIRTNVLAPFGKTTIVGGGGDGERETIVLITPR